jgi:hypothetical protein
MDPVYGFLVPLLCWVSQERRLAIWPLRASAAEAASSQPALGRERPLPGPVQSAHAQKYCLRWTGRDSFFDPGVQEVLMERHPSKGSFGKEGFKGYAIDAWRAVDQFALTRGFSDRSLAEFGAFMRLDPLWTTRLLNAVMLAHESQASNPKIKQPGPSENTRRDQIIHAWAECWIAHYRFQPSGEEQFLPSVT